MIWSFLHHWVYEDLWVPVWPNWAAGGIIGILAYIWGKREIIKIHNKLDRHHTEHMAAIKEVKK